MKKKDSDDPQFHYEIWQGPSETYGDEAKSISYVENHNGQCSYAELALDFEIAAEALIASYRQSDMGNWVAPVSHIVRQTLELRLKAFLQAVAERDGSIDRKPLASHNLWAIWSACKTWMVEQEFQILEDARLLMTERLLSAYHAIDPSGDLFRFGISRQTAFGKQKSYDRVGIDLPIFCEEFAAASRLLQHWESVVFRLTLAEEMQWDTDPYFDADDFPRSLQKSDTTAL